MAEQQQRRIEEVAPGLIRLAEGDTYVYLSRGSADLLADKYSLPRVKMWNDTSTHSVRPS